MWKALRPVSTAGVCTAICPAASFSKQYDPRHIANTVQYGNEHEIEQLLKGDTIWQCGECLSCKTRCPRGNTPGYIVQALRSLSIRTGFFTESREGLRQVALKRTIGEHMLQYGYCVYIDEVDNDMYPEQGPVWAWLRKNRREMLGRLGASYEQDRSGALRKIPKESLDDLQKIFDETGATAQFEHMEKLAAKKATELGYEAGEGKNNWFDYLYKG